MNGSDMLSMEGLVYLQDQHGLHLKWKLWVMIVRDSYLFLQGISIPANRVSIMSFILFSVYDSCNSHVFCISDIVTLHVVKICYICRRIKKVVQSTMVFRGYSINTLWSNPFAWDLREGISYCCVIFYFQLLDDSSHFWKISSTAFVWQLIQTFSSSTQNFEWSKPPFHVLSMSVILIIFAWDYNH